MAEPRKEYHARVWVRLSSDILPRPELSRDELEAHLKEALDAGEAGSPIASVAVSDPSDKRTVRR